MQERVTELEIMLMQHEDTIETLSTALHRQQLTILELQQKLELLELRFKTMQSSILKPEDEETPPPHY